MAPEFEVSIKITAASQEDANRRVEKLLSSLAKPQEINVDPPLEEVSPVVSEDPTKKTQRKPYNPSSRKELYNLHSEKILDYICDFGDQTIVLKDLKKYLFESEGINMDVPRIRSILMNLKGQGFKFIEYKGSHKKYKEAEAEQQIDAEINAIPDNSEAREEIIQKVSELWTKYSSVSAVQKELKYKNTGIISVTEALRILVDRGVFSSLGRPAIQHSLNLEMTPLERKAPDDFTINRRSLLD